MEPVRPIDRASSAVTSRWTARMNECILTLQFLNRRALYAGAWGIVVVLGSEP